MRRCGVRTAVLIAAALGGTLLAAACEGGIGPGPGAPGQTALGPAPTINQRSDWSAARSAAFDELTMTVRDERGWRLLWQRIGDPPPGPLPEGAMALAVVLGSRPTAGYLVEITDVRVEGGRIVARYRETAPAEGTMVAQVLTAPYTVRLVPLSALPVDYVRGD